MGGSDLPGVVVSEEPLQSTGVVHRLVALE